MNITKFIKKRILDDYGSIRRFALKVNIPTSTLNTALNKENGFNNMPVENAIKICNELGIDIEALYDSQSEPLTSKENRLLDIYRSVSAQDLIINICEEILDYETQAIEQSKTHPVKDDILIAASGAENVDDETMAYNIELAKQVIEQEEKKRKNKKNN